MTTLRKVSLVLCLFVASFAHAGKPYKGTVQSILVQPGNSGGGALLVGYVQLTQVAPAGGITVTLGSSKPSVATLPATATIPEGAIYTQFDVPTYPLTQMDSTTVSATYGSTTVTNVLTMVPARITLFFVGPEPQQGGNNSWPIYTYFLNNGIMAEDTVVTLTVGNPVLQCAPSVTIPAGTHFIEIPNVCTTSAVLTETTVNVTATHPWMSGTYSLTDTLTVTP